MSEHIEYEARTVRPYAVTGGRVRSARSDLPLEALVEAMPGAVASQGLPPEKRAILQHAASNYISVAELSALLHLPLGVIRILVSDLASGNTSYALAMGSLAVLAFIGLAAALRLPSTPAPPAPATRFAPREVVKQ